MIVKKHVIKLYLNILIVVEELRNVVANVLEYTGDSIVSVDVFTATQSI